MISNKDIQFHHKMIKHHIYKKKYLNLNIEEH